MTHNANVRLVTKEHGPGVGVRLRHEPVDRQAAIQSPDAAGQTPVKFGSRISSRPADTTLDADYLVYRLEEAGTALLTLPNTGYSTRLRSSAIDVVRSALEGYGWENYRKEGGRVRPSVPDAARITRMDEALSWISLIPADRYVLRRIVGARALVSPTTERHLFTWRRLGSLLGADHKAIQRWHSDGINVILAALTQRDQRAGSNPTERCGTRTAKPAKIA